MTPTTIAKYVKMMRKVGIASLTIGDVTIVLGPEPREVPKIRGSAKEEAVPVENQPSEEDLLYWSVG